MPPFLIATVSYLQCYVATHCQHFPSLNPTPPPLIHSLTRKKITQKHNIRSEKSLSPCCHASQLTIGRLLLSREQQKYTVHVELELTNAGYFVVIIFVL